MMDLEKLKQKKKAYILAHNYQLPEIQDAADFVGDSLELAQVAEKIRAKTIIVCGLNYMAETVALLNPDKKVLIPDNTVACPLTNHLTPTHIKQAKKENPGSDVVLELNSSLECKTLADSLCTSANVMKVVEKMKSKDILLGPEKNLCFYVQRNTDKNIIPLCNDCFCPVHNSLTLKRVKFIRNHARSSLIIVHPQCKPEVQEFADNVMGPSEMMETVKRIDFEVYVIGTEDGFIYRLQKQNPTKKFQPVNIKCPDMKKITLKKLYECLETGKHKVNVPSHLQAGAIKPLKKMLKISK